MGFRYDTSQKYSPSKKWHFDAQENSTRTPTIIWPGNWKSAHQNRFFSGCVRYLRLNVRQILPMPNWYAEKFNTDANINWPGNEKKRINICSKRFVPTVKRFFNRCSLERAGKIYPQKFCRFQNVFALYPNDGLWETIHYHWNLERIKQSALINALFWDVSYEHFSSWTLHCSHQ